MVAVRIALRDRALHTCKSAMSVSKDPVPLSPSSSTTFASSSRASVVSAAIRSPAACMQLQSWSLTAPLKRHLWLYTAT